MKNILGFVALVAGMLLFTSAVLITAKKEKTKAPEGFVLVPGGNVTVDTSKVSVQTFFISKCEVTNLQYRTFLKDLKAKGDTMSYRIAVVDSSKWSNKLMYNEPYVDYYFNHPAYDQYPVVNVSYEGAMLYCKWLTATLKPIPGAVRAEYRLPFRAEWIKAAKGGIDLTEYSTGGPYLFSVKGTSLYNFKKLGAESIHYNAETNNYEVIRDNGYFSVMDNADITAPVESYVPNDYGLYNMCGNVAEMIQEKGTAVGGSWNSPGYDIRIESVMNYEGPNPFVGFRPVITYLVDKE